MVATANPLNTSRRIDIVEAYNTVAYPYGVFSKTGLFESQPVSTTTIMAKVTQDGLGTMTGFTSRTERDAMRVSKQKQKAVALEIPYIKQASAVTYEDFAMRVGDWTNLTPETQELTINDVTLDRIYQMSLSMSQNMEYLALNATKGLVLDPYDGDVYANLFDTFGYTKVTETLDLTSADLDIFAWSVALKEGIQKRNRVSAVVPTVDILVDTKDMQAIQSHPSIALLRASLLAGTGLSGIQNQSKALYAENVLSEHGVSQVFDLQNGVRFITYPATFTRMDRTSASATVEGTAHTVVRGVSGLYKVAYAPAPYLSQLGKLGQPTYAWRTPVQDDQRFELLVESSPLYYMTQPDLAVEITIKKS